MRPVFDAVVLGVVTLDGLPSMEHHVGCILLAWAYSWVVAISSFLTGNGFHVSRNKRALFFFSASVVRI